MKVFFLFFFAAVWPDLYAQFPIVDSVSAATSYYRQGLKYKDGDGVEKDYSEAYKFFEKATLLGDPQSQYALGYFHYKGLGCEQSYKKAVALFAKGAFKGRDNSMYFYGLCFRNGYGLAKNEDSAQYWLSRSASTGYQQAIFELSRPDGENSNEQAKAMAQRIKNAAIPSKIIVNKYNKIPHHLPSDAIGEGNYVGYILQYDWSGQNVISSKKLNLNLIRGNNILTGKWIEEGSDPVAIRASLVADSLVFNNTRYQRRDHYSLDSAIFYQIQSGSLNLVQKGDSVFLAGNINMFSQQRNEPSKPLFVVLSAVRPNTESTAKQEKTRILKVYPNPFNKQINVEFELFKSQNIEVQLLALNGSILNKNPAGVLEAGAYSLPLLSGELASGIYLVKLLYGSKEEVLKIVKE